MQEYVTHSEEKLNKNKKIGNFATHSTREDFICSLLDRKHDFDDCELFKEKTLQ